MIDHGVQWCRFVKRECLGDPRLDAEVPAGMQASAQRAGDQDRIAGFRPVPADGPSGCRLADQV